MAADVSEGVAPVTPGALFDDPSRFCRHCTACRDHKKIVTIGLDPMVQEPAHQAFVARPLDCTVKPCNDGKKGKKNVTRVSHQPKDRTRLQQRSFLLLVSNLTGQQ
jgi:hypothetical protein